LELSKPVLTDPGSAQAASRGTRRTLVGVLEALLRLAHPLMPFITEEIWQRVAPLAGIRGETIMQQPYPMPDHQKIDQAASAEIDWLQGFVLGVRRIRAEMSIAPGKPLPILLANGSEKDHLRVERNRGYLSNLGRLQSLTWLSDHETAPESATALVGDMQVLIPMAGLIDKAAELTRLSKEIHKLRHEMAKGEAKLDNASFVGRAPPQVVEKERIRVREMRAAVNKLEEQRERIERI
jgi:valyl-tRNA synthetase